MNYAIGIAINPDTQAATITMDTFPAGNIQGEFDTNVLPTVTLPPVPSPLPIPSPVPVPSPSPDPVPVPSPSPVPSPINMKVNVASAIYNIIYMFERNQNRPAIIYAINNIIGQYSQYMSQNTINQLQNLIVLLTSRSSRMVIIRAINNILKSL